MIFEVTIESKGFAPSKFTLNANSLEDAKEMVRRYKRTSGIKGIPHFKRIK